MVFKNEFNYEKMRKKISLYIAGLNLCAVFAILN